MLDNSGVEIYQGKGTVNGTSEDNSINVVVSGAVLKGKFVIVATGSSNKL